MPRPFPFTCYDHTTDRHNTLICTDTLIVFVKRRLTDGRVPSDFSLFDVSDYIVDMNQVTAIQPIAKGAFGTVELAVYKGEQVAMKKQLVRNAGLDKYLESELTILKNLTPHPNVMRYIGAGWRAAGRAEAESQWTEVWFSSGTLSLYWLLLVCRCVQM